MSYLGQGLGLGREERFTATATAGQTTVSVGDDGRSISYTPNYVDVYLNGSKQVNGSDVTVSSGTSIVFASALTAGDVVDVVAPGYFQPADTVSRSLGGTFLGPVNLPSGGLNVGSGQLRVDSSGRVLKNAQPAFRCRGSGGGYAQGASQITAVSQILDNIGGHYSSSTHRFTAPVSGRYLFWVNLFGTGGSDRIGYAINGNNQTSPYIMQVVDNAASGSIIVQLNANDYFYIFAQYGGSTIYLDHCGWGGYFLG